VARPPSLRERGGLGGGGNGHGHDHVAGLVITADHATAHAASSDGSSGEQVAQVVGKLPGAASLADVGLVIKGCCPGPLRSMGPGALHRGLARDLRACTMSSALCRDSRTALGR
jgi:hypothetical protein